MKNKTVKEKVEEIIKKQTLAIICKECNGGGYNYDKKENCEECEGTGLSEWRFGTAIEDIDKLYRKEMENKIQNLFDSIQFILVEEAVKTRVFDRILRQFVSVRDNKNKVKVLKKMPKAKISYTCCNIEVSEPKGTEVMCRACGEWCSTK